MNQTFDKLIKDYTEKSIDELRFIIRNDHLHSSDQINAANIMIDQKMVDRKNQNTDISKKIDEIIRKETWFDFHVLNFDGFKLTIAGSINLTYYHTLEIIFEDIFFVSGFFKGWTSDTNQKTFFTPDNEKEMNEKYEIEQGYQLFIFRAENYTNDVVIAAKNVTFNTDTVFYYERPDLKENERIADFVKKRVS